MEQSKAAGIKKNLPNITSFIRIAGSFALPFLMWESWERDITIPVINAAFINVPVIWIIVYLFLLFTDKLDGTFARMFKAESEFGAALDVIADIVVLVFGATLCFVGFVADNLETWQFWLYVGMMIWAVLNRFFVFILAKKYHGKGNMVHTFFQKAFTVACYIAIFFWAFLRTIPEWTIYTLMLMSIYATIDESIYCVRCAKYDVNFKGHGFEKYEKRSKTAG